MSVAGRRQERLADQIRHEVAVMIAEELKDPRIGFTTVTAVELSPDLHHARVMVSVLGDARGQEETLRGLSSAAGYIRQGIGRRLRIRRAPELTFVLDHGVRDSLRVEELLEKIKSESDHTESGT